MKYALLFQDSVEIKSGNWKRSRRKRKHIPCVDSERLSRSRTPITLWSIVSAGIKSSSWVKISLRSIAIQRLKCMSLKRRICETNSIVTAVAKRPSRIGCFTFKKVRLIIVLLAVIVVQWTEYVRRNFKLLSKNRINKC